MELYDAIFYRKSTRKYSNKRVKESLLEEVKNVCSQITYLNKDLNIKAHVVDRGHLVQFLMGKNCKVKAPHYIIITSNNGEDYLQNIGFAMEEVVLKLTTLGLATCWLECNIKREDILEFVDLSDLELDNQGNDEIIEYEDKKEELNLEQPYSIIAFGYPEGNAKLFRNDKDTDRKRINHVCKKLNKDIEKIAESVRWAPSMKNSQPWVLYNDSNMIHLYEEKQKKNLKDTNKISMGIALRHIDVACKELQLEVDYSSINAKKRIGKEYYITAIFK